MRDYKIKQPNQGFTLIELLIAIAIISILAMIALPAYQDSVIKSKRSVAQGDLLSLANAMERYFTTNGTYTGATAASVYSATSPTDGGTTTYNLSVAVGGTGTTYTLTAEAIGTQAGNGDLELTNAGVQRWDRDDDGFGGTDNCWDLEC